MSADQSVRVEATDDAVTVSADLPGLPMAESWSLSPEAARDLRDGLDEALAEVDEG